MSIHEVDPAVADPVEFAQLVKRTPVEELRQVLAGQRRDEILHGLLRRMPEALRADVARGTEAVVHWSIGGRPDGRYDVHQMVISDGRCVLSAQPDQQPKLTLTLAAVDFVHLVTGNARAVMLVMKGKLKTRGDIGLTAKFPNLFQTPKP